MADLGVEVAYAGPEGQAVVALAVPVGTTVWEAVGLALPQLPPGIRPDQARLGIFGKKVEPGQVLGQGDRVEIYRALTLDPMEARRRRAAR
ncbi:RnfH family protein [Luteibacter aegosomatissinici]|uniref:RnfH family protein n=1 Tax=Luteibacter aegosomatissinici TaxID=2911539 RepID=UPI001FFA1A6D|nr:RnfH family protein [Luteibacter aegosomatissinici]UPG92993.1 RnfH family protein [Luteibacter aegosomatissinici]